MDEELIDKTKQNYYRHRITCIVVNHSFVDLDERHVSKIRHNGITEGVSVDIPVYFYFFFVEPSVFWWLLKDSITLSDTRIRNQMSGLTYCRFILINESIFFYDKKTGLKVRQNYFL